jgi:hypothetical protein
MKIWTYYIGTVGSDRQRVDYVFGLDWWWMMKIVKYRYVILAQLGQVHSYVRLAMVLDILDLCTIVLGHQEVYCVFMCYQVHY